MFADYEMTEWALPFAQAFTLGFAHSPAQPIHSSAKKSMGCKRTADVRLYLRMPRVYLTIPRPYRAMYFDLVD